jgi:hypothetical protein
VGSTRSSFATPTTAATSGVDSLRASVCLPFSHLE